LVGVDLPFTDYGKGLRAAERIVDIIAEALTNYYGPDFETRNYDQRNIVTGLLTQKNEDSSWRLGVREAAKILRGILFAGHETTSNAISVMLFFLARNPEVGRPTPLGSSRVTSTPLHRLKAYLWQLTAEV